jgi:hypothetical protein
MAQRYVINAPVLVAVQRNDKTVITLPSASVIEASEPVDSMKGLIEVTFKGETVLMFAEDLRMRGRLVTTVTHRGFRAAR